MKDFQRSLVDCLPDKKRRDIVRRAGVVIAFRKQRRSGKSYYGALGAISREYGESPHVIRHWVARAAAAPDGDVACALAPEHLPSLKMLLFRLIYEHRSCRFGHQMAREALWQGWRLANDEDRHEFLSVLKLRGEL